MALLTIGQVAQKIGCETWQVRRLYERGFLPPAVRVGRHRAVPEEEIPRVKKAAVEAGYLK